ncbi:MAG: bifunctional methylenetetrahydrofolate dehydrogenase/methenyltetrahydrofolate cyclohydrolase FolD [Endozoicomonadaceae bacterium]|nr:bifunctional methylenetetrahydrofolate dehydrogenase/methenyltetrahydrofolate cyclohydrolase FolD [Endozoicomonadaceae bacterium]
MSAQLIDGKKIALTIKNALKEKIKCQCFSQKIQPKLVVILVGHHAASTTYVQAKEKACAYVGIQSLIYDLPETCPESKLIQVIQDLNHTAHVHGILVQLPLPSHINKSNVLEQIDPRKDVDGFHPYNLGRLCQRRPLLKPCTPKGVMTLLQHTKTILTGQDALIIGASEIVGRPMALELLLSACTVTIAHRFTKNLEHKVNQADIVIAAVGQANLVKGNWIKKNAIVIDVGINRLENGTLCGDVEFNQAVKKASWITPVPGGVGPMTVACLLENTWYAFLNATS